MVTSWIERAKQFKSPLCVVAGFLLRSRETQAERARKRAQEVQQLRRMLAQQQADYGKQGEELADKDRQISRLKTELQQLRTQPPMLPDDPPLPGHEFGPKMISLCVNLARRIGLRAVPDVLKMIFAWLGLDGKIANWTTVRTWMLRVGVSAIKQPIEQADDWIWMADHSNQIGTEKALSVIGLRASNMPPRGRPLKHKDVRVLELSPGTSWKREDMAAAYDQLAQQCGTPLAVLVDGAVELREGVEMSEMKRKNGTKPIVLGDFKHFAANVLKRIVGKDKRFAEFTTQLGRTRSAVQQTELAHLTPPGAKPKARFMNLAPTLTWAKMVSWQLSQPHSEARRGLTADRMNEKLGWLRTYREDIDRWHRCQEVVSASLEFINEQGVFKGAAGELCSRLRTLRNNAEQPVKDSDASRQVAACLLCFVRRSESKLDEGQRLPLSTEILESSFGLFKQLERQHSKGGFTSLLATYGCLLHATTAESIRRDFALVSVKETRAWVSQKLGTTLTSKRQTAYREFRNAA
jgi:hypothetical protein